MKNNALTRFVIKVAVIYLLLSLPFRFLENAYRNFYISTATNLFQSTHENGYVRFLKDKNPEIVQVQVANKTTPLPNGRFEAAFTDVNIRLRGYISTAFLLALIASSSTGKRRKLAELLIGFFAISFFVFVKQWIHILYILISNPFLKLTDYSAGQEKFIRFVYENLIAPSGPTLFVVFLIWLILSFRKNDFVETN
ncbi:MAG: hypothetical protein KA430_11035 [Bacteroidia bacterium]|nr:hypothetical protein [Bacteroidia bacterium]